MFRADIDVNISRYQSIKISKGQLALDQDNMKRIIKHTRKVQFNIGISLRYNVEYPRPRFLPFFFVTSRCPWIGHLKPVIQHNWRELFVQTTQQTIHTVVWWKCNTYLFWLLQLAAGTPFESLLFYLTSATLYNQFFKSTFKSLTRHLVLLKMVRYWQYFW